MSREPTFAKEDVYAMARSILENPPYESEHGYHLDLYCPHCGKSCSVYRAPPKFPHAANCPYLIAQDVLTGCDESNRGGEVNDHSADGSARGDLK